MDFSFFIVLFLLLEYGAFSNGKLCRAYFCLEASNTQYRGGGYKICEGDICFGAMQIYDYSSSLYTTLGNGDGFVNPSEEIRLDISLSNNTKNKLEGLVGTLYSDSAFASIDALHSTKILGSLIPINYWTSSNKTPYYASFGNYHYSSELNYSFNPLLVLNPDKENTFKVKISSLVADGTYLPFRLELKDLKGKTYTFSFYLKTCSESGLVIGGFVYYRSSGNRYVSDILNLYDKESAEPIVLRGNGDGKWQAGEIVRINPGIKNLSKTVKSIAQVKLGVENPAVKIDPPSFINYPELYSGKTGYLNNSSLAGSSNSFRIHPGDEILSGSKLIFHLILTDSENTEYEDIFEADIF